MLGWDDMPKEPPSVIRASHEHKAPPAGSPGALKAEQHSETVIFADGKKQGWWQASDKGILNEAEAADEKSQKKGFTPQAIAGVSQQYGSIFGRAASSSEHAASAVADTAKDAAYAISDATKGAVEAVSHAATGAVQVVTSAVAEVTTKVGEMDPFAELVSPGAKPAEGAVKPGEAAAIPATHGSSGGGAHHPEAVGSPKDGVIFADGKKSGWWQASDKGILNEAEAEDEAKGTAKKFEAQFSVAGQKNNYGSMLNWKKDEPKEVKEGGKDEDWDPFQSASKN